MGTTEFTSRSPSETWEIGEQIGKRAKRGDLYAIHGELGAGKTQLVKGIAKGMGVEDWLYVVSPSFTIMNIYEGKDISLCHVDLYRVERGECEPLSIDEFLEGGVVAVEWAERADWWDDIVKIDIEVVGENERKITVVRI
jgi:tRNA threonylcarbamoyladenosine biosynthesis protein TsaE